MLSAMYKTKKSTFELFITPAIQQIILKMINLKGKHLYHDSWKDLDAIDLREVSGLSQ